MLNGYLALKKLRRVSRDTSAARRVQRLDPLSRGVVALPVVRRDRVVAQQ
jgi:hypothetical protein